MTKWNVRKHKGIALCLGVLLAALAQGAHADVEVGELSTVVDKFSVGLDLSTFYRVDVNPYFGASGQGTHGTENDDAHWGEVFSKLRFTAAKDVGWSELSAQFAPFYAQTIDQDVYGLAKDQSQFGVDQAWLEAAGLFGSPVSVRVGRQDVQIEKWFLVGSSNDQEAAGWLFYRYSFPFAVQVNADFSPVKATAFWARPGGFRQPGDVELGGVNLHYDVVEGSYLYGGAYRTWDEGQEPEQDIIVYDVGGEVSLFGLVLEGEFAYQTGEAGELDRKAFAWFASAGYTLPVAFSPYLRAMYVFYSGDDDPNDGDLGDWDPFFNGFIGWNRWVQGEQTGEVWLVQTNKKVAIGEVGIAPVEGMGLSLHYLNHKIAEKESFGTTSDDWGNEVNLFLDYQVSDQLFLHVGTGFVVPGDAAEEVTGDDKTAYFGQVWLSYSL